MSVEVKPFVQAHTAHVRASHSHASTPGSSRPLTHTIHAVNWHTDDGENTAIAEATHAMSSASISGVSNKIHEGSSSSRLPVVTVAATTIAHTSSSATSSSLHAQSSQPSNNSSRLAGTTTSTAPAPVAVSSSSSTRPVKPSLTPSETLKNTALSSLLTPFEQSEILEFSSIYFVGAIPPASKIPAMPHTPANNGFDDDRGDYKIILGDHLEYRYEVLSLLGKGSFGAVLKCFDHKKDMIVALKIIRNKKRFHHQALIEVKILEHLMAQDREHKSHIVRVHGYFYFRNHLCITFEPLAINLYEFLKNNHFQGLSLGLIRRFAIQILTALSFLSRHHIIHCDLKPENILLKSLTKSSVKLIDFGSSCFEDERIYTYIQSRFYRAPEVLLGLPYSCAIDMWSLGCILCELYTGYPLFPGENEQEQLLCQMEVLGLPPKRMTQEATRRKQFFDATNAPIVSPNSRGKVRVPGSKSMEVAVKCKDTLFLSFIRKCLRWEPKMRLTPDQALQHEWIRDTVVQSAQAAQSQQATPTSTGASQHQQQSHYPTTSQQSPAKSAHASPHSTQAQSLSHSSYVPAAAASSSSSSMLAPSSRAKFPPIAPK